MIIERVETGPPFEAFEKIRAQTRLPFIFCAGEGSRYSYSGGDPRAEARTENGKTLLDGRELKDPFEAAKAMLSGRGEKGPFPFNGGVAGYFSYDLKDLIEPPLVIKLSKKDGLPIPEAWLGYYDPVVVFDNETRESFIVSVSGDRERVASLKELLHKKNARTPAPAKGLPGGFTSDTTREEFIGAVLRAKEYIASGDIYQINLSHRITARFEGDPFALFKSVTRAHPAPFSSFIDFGPFQVISNSPERLLKVSGGFIETGPIKGTRPRGKTPEQDLQMIRELRESPKENAEHVMIVDLERNDLGKVSVPGSVEVSAFCEIKTYTHLHHMVSTVRGRLLEGVGPLDGLKAVFPGGSITGAPKVRAMEIIDELERSKRSIYTGGIGWVDVCGEMDFAMAIRTAVTTTGRIYLNVGGGIVADSVPEDEYEETMLKASDFLTALGFDKESR